jgi:uncharacterized SAM-binding protein YcdF (DUF218 family)
LPRQIIDTESSRPAYVRRRTRRLLVTLLIIILLVVAGWLLVRHLAGQESSPARGTTHPAFFVPDQKGVLGAGETPGVKHAA